MDTILKTYKVPEQNLETLKARMDKLIRRCNRIKVAAPKLTVGSFEDISYTAVDDGVKVKCVRRMYDVTLESAGRPKINGYEFAAVLSPTVDENGAFLGNVLRHVPGFEGDIPTRFRNASNYCDHCKTERRRLETFVIVNEAGFRQIGRNCLANYLGLADPETYAALAEILISADDLCASSEDGDGFGGDRIRERIALDDVLGVAASAIRQYGWLSNKSAREFEKTSTSTRVSHWIFGSSKTREAFEYKLIVIEEDKKLAEETIEWLNTLSVYSENEYMANLALLAKSTAIEGKNFGIAVSAISSYSREKERQIRRNARIESDANSQFVGAEGDRVVIEGAILVYTQEFEGDYGVSTLYKMKQGDNVLVWFASGSNPMGLEQGAVVPNFKGTIKKHEIRDSIKQTKLSRCTQLPTPEQVAAAETEKAEKKELKKLMKIVAWG